ncbi:hypothetical protein AAC387_Pa04g3041 [Persea americana]
MFVFDIHLDLLNGEPVSRRLLFRNLVLFVSACFYFICNYTFRLFKIISNYVFRVQVENDSNCPVICQKEDEDVLAEKDSGCFDSSSEVVAFEKSGSENDLLVPAKQVSPGFSFKFQSMSPEDMMIRNKKTVDMSDDHREESPPEMKMNIHKYSFLVEGDVTGFVREPEAAESFSIEESYVNLKGTCFGGGDGEDIPVLGESKDLAPSRKDFHRLLVDLEIEPVGKREMQGDAEFLSEKEMNRSDFHTKSIKSCSRSSMDEYQITSLKGYELLPVNNFCGFGYESVVVGCRGAATLMDFDGDHRADSTEEDVKIPEEAASQQQSSDAESIDGSDGFPSVDDDYKFYASDTELADFSDGPSVAYQMKDDELTDLSDGSSVVYQMKDNENPSDDFMFEKGFFELDLESFDDEEMDKSEPWYYQNSFLSGANYSSSESAREEHGKPECEWDDFHGTVDESRETEEPHLQNPSISGYDDSDGLESLWEHEDLIQQLRTELKKVQAIGLPTIYEESESSEAIDDLLPWNIKEKLVQEDPLDELHKFHKSYTERMRKLDILNYQKMHAIGFLQLKGPPLRSTAIRKTSFQLRRSRKFDVDPSVMFVREVQSDLEMVYVGQACLSWEFLHWQHQKALELPECERRQYNQVAGEFQQLQVLVQRFLENEPFLKGPRVQNYIQNRCVFRKLLQVPAIKEDCFKEKKKERIRENNAITSGMLVQIMEEVMRTLWEFIKADKDEADTILKGFLRTPAELHDPTDLEILRKVQADLQKKEKKLRDLLKTGNCLVKRFQKHKENRSDLVLFFSQVDMKLVSRVLKMSRVTTDQLLWCHKKLSKITFTNRKIYREPSFLLFPC